MFKFAITALLSALLLLYTVSAGLQAGAPDEITQADVCIYGGTSAGAIAAVAAQRMGRSVIIIEPKKHIGGLTSGGLGSTDVGKKYAIQGISREFYRRLGKYYGGLERWDFEPHVAEQVYNEMLKEGNIPVIYGYRVATVDKENGRIQEIILESADGAIRPGNRKVRAKVFIDCSYEGDLMARAKVSYTTGREGNEVYNEVWNGVQPGNRHQYPDGISPYKEPGNPASGLIWGVSGDTLQPRGTGDKKIQAYNFRVCLTKDKNNMIPITRPDGYDSAKYELFLRLVKAKKSPSLRGYHLIVSNMPNNKTDINSEGGLSTDYVGGNWDYPDGDYARRQAIWKDHELYTKGLLYFLGHDNRVPEHLRKEMLVYGYPKDEYQDNGGFTHELYIREARRMLGAYVMTEHNCTGQETVPDGIAWGSYNMDSHHAQRIVINGMVKNEGEVTEVLPKAYPIAYRSITPKSGECKNLLVPVCLSASHIAYGSIRMEPVFMELGQAAGMAAVMAINSNVSVQEIDLKQLRDKLANDPYLNGIDPDIIVDFRDKRYVSTTGNWEEKIEYEWSSREPFIYAKAGARRAKFLLPVKKDGRYSVHYYNPGNKELEDGMVPLQIKHGANIQTVNIDLKHNQEWNERLIYVGTWELKANEENFLEVIGDSVHIPIQASHLIIVPSEGIQAVPR